MNSKDVVLPKLVYFWRQSGADNKGVGKGIMGEDECDVAPGRECGTWVMGWVGLGAGACGRSTTLK